MQCSQPKRDPKYLSSPLLFPNPQGNMYVVEQGTILKIDNIVNPKLVLSLSLKLDLPTLSIFKMVFKRL